MLSSTYNVFLLLLKIVRAASNSSCLKFKHWLFVALQICYWTLDSTIRSDAFIRTRLFRNYRDWPDCDGRQKAAFSPVTNVDSVFTEKNKSELIKFAINIPHLCIGTVTNTTAMFPQRELHSHGRHYLSLIEIDFFHHAWSRTALFNFSVLGFAKIELFSTWQISSEVNNDELNSCTPNLSIVNPPAQTRLLQVGDTSRKFECKCRLDSFQVLKNFVATQRCLVCSALLTATCLTWLLRLTQIPELTSVKSKIQTRVTLRFIPPQNCSKP